MIYSGQQHDAQLQALKRNLYLAMLSLGSLAAWASLLFIRHESFGNQLVDASYLTLTTGLTALLWWRPKSLRLVEVSTFFSTAVYFVLKLALSLYTAQFLSDTQSGFFSFVTWVPLTYFWAYLVFGSKRGLIASLLVYGMLLSIGLGYGSANGFSGAYETHFKLLGEFYLASVAFLSALFGFASLLEQQMKVRTATEAAALYAYTDSLTGLPNRLLFRDRLKQAMALMQRHNDQLAVFFVDLDRFKLVNDTLGHAAGDVLLQEVAARFQLCLRESDTLARISGDEFALVVPEVGGNDAAAQVAEKLIAALETPFEVNDLPLYITGSIGISLYPDHGHSIGELLLKADTAMYRAKEGGRGRYQLYTDEMGQAALDRLELEQQLRRAFDEGELALHYQPMIDMGDQKIIGAEALLRWQHPLLGNIAPETFIPIAEDTGLIIPIGNWVLREACRQNRAWQDAGYAPVVVAVNVSAAQLAQSNFVEVVAHTLTTSGLEPQWLELELTESMVMHDVAAGCLKELRSLGVQLSLDDFGTGYSSLSHLQGLSIHNLKIDRSFIRNLRTASHQGDTGMAFVETIVALARQLGLRVVAEGVETAQQLELLRGSGCDKAQGYLFAKSLPPAELEALLSMVDFHPVTGTL